MNPEAEREEALFQAAARLAASERVLFLDLKCANDVALRRRLEALLAAHDAPGVFMAEIPDGRATIKIEPTDADDQAVGQAIGRYKILEKIGEGGCGVVYVAEQSVPIRRRVALKVIKMGMDTKQVVARFEAERQALALMDHPNIAKVLDAGATETGRPYFVMELVRGVRITEYCDEDQLSTRERLDLFIQVCNAIQHAHQKGIIHRDIKPSNILVTLHDGVPVPKVIDFGIAKATEARLTDATLYTQLHQLLGTPAYMSPEQAEMSGLDVDTRSDIYSLGVLLYELLVGITPFDARKLIAAGVDAMRKTIRETEPQRPSTRLAGLGSDELTSTAKRRRIEPPRLVHLLKGDLDWIVMRCLEKNRTRRYETANGLAMDIQRHLSNEPVVARPQSKMYRFVKTVRRNTGVFVAVGMVLATLVVGIVISVSQLIRAKNAEEGQRAEADRARLAEEDAEEQSKLATDLRISAENGLYAADMNVVQQALDEANLRRARERLRAHEPQVGGADLRGWEWWYFSGLARGDEVSSHTTMGNPVVSILPSPLPDRVVIGREDGTVEYWDLGNLRGANILAQVEGGLQGLIRDATGGFIAGHSKDGTVRIWDYRDPGRLTFLYPWKSTEAIRAFSPARKLIATVAKPRGRWELPDSDYGLTAIWNYETGEKLKTLGNSGEQALFSSDGETLITGSWRGTATVWNTADLTVRQILPQVGRMNHMAHSPDSRWLVVCSFEGSFLCDLKSKDPGSSVIKISTRLWGIQARFAPDGTRFAIAYSDGTIGIWNPVTRLEIGLIKGQDGDSSAMAFSHDGKWLVSADPAAELIRLFKSEPSPDREMKIGMFSPGIFSSDSRLMAVADKSGTNYQCAVWDLATNEKKVLAAEPNPVGFADSGTTLITATVSAPLPVGTGRISGVKRWNLPTGSFEEKRFLQTNHLACALALSPDGSTLAVGDDLGDVLLWNTRTGAIMEVLASSSGRVWNLIFSRDGKKLAVGIINDIAVWDLQRKRRVFSKAGLGSPLAISPDGQTVAMGTESGILVCQIATGQIVQTLTGHRERVYWLAFSPDGRTLASAAEDLKLWSLAAEREVASFRAMDFFKYVDFSPNGKYLVGGDVGNAYVWSASRPEAGVTIAE